MIKYWFDIKRTGNALDSTAVSFWVEANNWDDAVARARQEAGINFNQHPHQVWIIRGGEKDK